MCGAMRVVHFSVCGTCCCTLFYWGNFAVDIKLELLKGYISDFINSKLEDFEIDADKIANTTAIKMLSEIQKIISNEDYSDFEIVEEIVCLFEKNGIDFGSCHDF